MRRSNAFSGTVAIAAFAVILWGCSFPVAPSGKTGSLSISLTNSITAKTLTPPVSMAAASYTITGTGPNSATFTAASTGAAVTENGLAFGSWTIVVNALNANGTLIGTGTAAAQVHTGETASVTVTVTPVTGAGALSLTVSWPAEQVQAPSITASLTPALGTAQGLAFVVTGSTATYTNAAIGNGYYTLAFTVNDNGVAEAGAVEVVRIVAGQATSGTYTFANVNRAGGGIQVNITANMQNPLDVAMTGAVATMSAGTTQALSADVSNYSGNVSYVWYVNGVSQAAGATYSFGTGVSAGYYRIDVTAFAADGTRAGSATTDVQVLAAAPPSQTISFTALDYVGTLRDHDVAPDGTVTVLSLYGNQVLVDRFGPEGTHMTGPVVVGNFSDAGFGSAFAVFVSRVSKHTLVVWQYYDRVVPVLQLRYSYLDENCHLLVSNRVVWDGTYDEFFDAQIDDAGRRPRSTCRLPLEHTLP